MRRLIVPLLGIAFVYGTSQIRAAEPAIITPTQIARLESLCRVWGVVKFFHPWIVAPPDGKPIDWDAALVEAIPLVEKATTAEEFRTAVDQMLQAVRDRATRATLVRDANGRRDPAAVDPGLPETMIIEAGGKNILIIKTTPWPQLAAYEEKSPGNLFTQAIAGADMADAIVVDVRGVPGMRNHAGIVANALENAFGALIKSDLTLTAIRTRFHRGYAPEQGSTSGGYHSGFSMAEASVLRAKPGPSAGKRVIFLTNADTSYVGPLIAALQATGQAVMLHHANRPHVFSPGATYSMSLTDGVAVMIRTGDAINADGSFGLTPDMVIDENTGSDGDPLMTVALAIARGETIPPPRAPKRLPAVPTRITENKYPELIMPNREYRLLGLFRVWNVMHYFFPYKDLMDRSWDSVLSEFIPRFAEAKTPHAFGLAVLEFVAHLQDSHVNVTGGGPSSAAYSQMGIASPLALIRHLHDEVVIVAADDSVKDRVQVGDVVLAIDGESIAERSSRLAKFIAASTPQSLNLLLGRALLRGQPNSTASLKLRGKDGTIREEKIPRPSGAEYAVAFRALYASRQRKTPVFGVLPEGYGYFDLVKLTVPQINDAFDSVRQTTALIMDMRGYPQGTSWAICSRLTDKPAKRSLFHCPFRDSPDSFDGADLKFLSPIVPSPLWKYTGRIVVLINEDAVSQAEGSCLGFENAAKGRITFIGTPTTGANGDVTNTSMPGGIRISFTGQSVRHADGRQLQRVGIQPDIRVEATIAGIVAGKDEVLEAAITFLDMPEAK